MTNMMKAIKEQVPDAIWKYKVKQNKVDFKEWKSKTHPKKPTEQELEVWLKIVDDEDVVKKNDRKKRKRSAMQAIGIQKKDIQGLVELIQDGDDE